MTSTSPTPDDAIRQLQESWAADQPLSIESLLQQYPDLIHSNGSAVDLIYAEVLLRESHGEPVDESDYIDRFPNYADSIRRQFQLHKALTDPPAIADRTDHPDDTLTGFDGPESLSLPRIEGFDLRAVLGRGGTGIAYRAFDLNLKRNVALKVLRLDDPAQQQRLLREAEAAAALQHPGIVRIYQVGQHQGRPFLVMELIEGESLEAKLRSGPLAIKTCLQLITAIGEAVEAAHQQNIIHRDLKPGNVLIDRDEQPYVCDFGLARQLDTDLTAHTTGDVLGTPAFMPPEQAAGDSVDHRADVYSLGATLYNTLTGRPPFQAASAWEILNQVMTADPVPPRRLNPAVPRDLEIVCLRALHKNPDRRFASAQQLVDELRRVQAGQPILTRPAGAAERFWKLCRRNPVTSTLLSVTVVALATVAVVSFLSEREVAAALEKSESALTAAETQRDVALDAMQNLVTNVNNDLTRYEASVEARAGVLSSAIAGLERIVETSGQREDILSAMCAARCQYAFILSQQGRNQEATEQILAAQELAESYESETGAHERVFVLNQLTQHYIRIADVAQAVATGAQGRSAASDLIEQYPDSLRAQKMWGTVLTNYGNALAAQGQVPAAIEQLAIAQTQMRQLHEQHPDDPTIARLLIDVDLGIAGHYFTTQQLTAAEQSVQEASQVLRSDKIDLQQDTQLFRKYLNASRLSVVARITRMQYEEAIELAQETQQQYQHLVDVEPKRPGFRLKLAVISDDLAKAQLAVGKLDEAASNLQLAVAQFREGMKLGGPEYRVQRYAIAQSLSRLADVQTRQGQLAESVQTLMEVATTIEPLVEEFQLQQPYDALLQQIELSKALADLPNEAEAANAERVKRAYEAWTAIRDGDTATFEKLKPTLQQDLAAATDPVVSASLRTMLAISLGRAYQHAIGNEETPGEGAENETAEQLAQQAIDQIQQVLATPGADTMFHLTAPDFQSLRSSAAWKAAFLVQ